MMRCPSLLWYPVRQLRAAVLTVAVVGCAPWPRIPAPAPASLPPDTHIQLWLGRRAVVLREVTVEVDSIRGRPVGPLGARSAAWVVFPLLEVDSFRIRPHDRENWFGAGVTAGLLAGIAVTAAVFRWAAGN
jgi:hypothetical protein